MRKVSLNNHIIELYDSIDELPINRYYKYNKYLIIDSGIGGDIESISNKLGVLAKHIELNNGLALTELENIRKGLFLVLEEYNPRYFSFAVLIHKVDGEILEDISEENLKRVINKIGSIKKGWFDNMFEAIKKKIETELGLYFPKIFDDSLTKEYYDLLRKHTLLYIDSILTKTHNKELKEIENKMITFVKPKNFDGINSVEIQYDKQYAEMSILISKELGINVDSLTTLRYFQAYEFINNMSKNGRKTN